MSLVSSAFFVSRFSRKRVLENAHVEYTEEKPSRRFVPTWRIAEIYERRLSAAKCSGLTTARPITDKYRFDEASYARGYREF